jgi:hypothetical protein
MPSTPQDFQKSKKKDKKLETTSASQWKKNAGAKPVDIELPSGNVAKVKQIPMPTLLADGLFPDSLAGFVREAINKDEAPADVKATADKQISELTKNPQDLADVFALFDKILVLAVVEPAVLPVPEDDNDREDELLYADEVDMEDKMFIFNFCVGGSKDLDRFRAESAAAMGSMAAIESVQNPS